MISSSEAKNKALELSVSSSCRFDSLKGELPEEAIPVKSNLLLASV